MNEKYNNLPLRNGVGIVVLNKKNQIFVAKRIDNPKNFWQMPQGGVDNGEDFYQAALRELEEETSIKTVKLINEIEDYDGRSLFKNHLIGIWKSFEKTKPNKKLINKMKFYLDELDRRRNTNWRKIYPYLDI